MKADKIEKQKKKENEILSNSCKKNPEHIELINNLLTVQKTKILLRKKHGLSADIETQLERHLAKTSKAKVTEYAN